MKNWVLLTLIVVFLGGVEATFAVDTVMLVSDTFNRTGNVVDSKTEAVVGGYQLTWQKPSSSKVATDTIVDGSVKTGTGSAGALSVTDLLGKTLEVRMDITMGDISGYSGTPGIPGTKVARGTGLGFFNSMSSKTSESYNREGFSGIIIMPAGGSDTAGTVYYGYSVDGSGSSMTATKGNVIAGYNKDTSYTLSYNTQISADGKSAVISNVQIGGTAMFAEGTKFNIPASDGLSPNYFGYLSSSGAGNVNGKADNFSISQSFGTVVEASQEFKPAAGAVIPFDVKVKAGGTFNVAEYLPTSDLNPGYGEIVIAGTGRKNDRGYVDTANPTNYATVPEGAIIMGGAAAEHAIFPNIVVDAAGAVITKVDAEGTSNRLILKGDLSGGSLTTYGNYQKSTVATDGGVNLDSLRVATGTFQFNSTTTAVPTATYTLENGIDVEKGAVLHLNRFTNVKFQKSDASLATITLNDSTLKTTTPSGNWTLQSNLTLNGASKIQYTGAYAIIFSGGTLHGGTDASLSFPGITGGGFILQDGAKLTGALDFKGPYKLRIDSANGLEGNLTVSGGVLHFSTATGAGMTATSTTTMAGGSLEISSGVLRGTVTMKSGVTLSSVISDFQSGTLTFDGGSNSGKAITMNGGTLAFKGTNTLTGTVTMNGGAIQGFDVTSVGDATLQLNADTTLTHALSTGGRTFKVKNINGPNQKLTYTTTTTGTGSISVFETNTLNVKELNYLFTGGTGAGTRKVLNIRGTATLGSGGLTKTGSGIADFHLYGDSTVSLAAGVASSSIAAEINTRLIGGVEFDIDDTQTLTLNSPIITTSSSTTQKLTKTGGGMLVLNGENTYTNIDGVGTDVQGGQLFVTGSLADDVTVGENGTLGTGTDTLAGTLAITGNLDVFGRLALDAFPTGNDLITSTGAMTFAEGSGIDLDLSDLIEIPSAMEILKATSITSAVPFNELVNILGTTEAMSAYYENGSLFIRGAVPSSVPEPTAWWLLLLGWGWVWRKRVGSLQ